MFGECILFSLLPLTPVSFQPEFLLVNDNETLLIVAGAAGVLVMELPSRCPPYGAFQHNKDVVYCKNVSLDERLFLHSGIVEVRQVHFHPGSIKNNHILVLSSDNIFRLYLIENSSPMNVGAYKIGDIPRGMIPGSKTTFLSAFGEVAVDFAFGQPELENLDKSIFVADKPKNNLSWPIYVLRGDGKTFIVKIPLEPNTKHEIRGPISNNVGTENFAAGACSIICLNTNPEIVCIANSNGTIYQSVVLPIDDQETKLLKNQRMKLCEKELISWESVELELGLSTTAEDHSYTCPVFLHKDESRPGRYFATHSAGIHSITISCLKDLQNYVNSNSDDILLEDIFNQESRVEYVVCTKTSTSQKPNPVIGFALYYHPISLISFLADGTLMSLAILTTDSISKVSDVASDNKQTSTSPLQKVLMEPFDVHIQKILQRSSQQPILKLGGNPRSQKECYELLQRVTQVFREYFENHSRAREEIEKRVKALRRMKAFQLEQLEVMNKDKQNLQKRAECLAEKYEDIKDKQDEIMKKSEKLLVFASQKKLESSDAEVKFLKDLGEYKEKVEAYKKSIDKLKNKKEYQKLKISNWKSQETKKETELSDVHAHTIKTNLQDSSVKIAEMIQQVNEFKNRLNLK